MSGDTGYTLSVYDVARTTITLDDTSKEIMAVQITPNEAYSAQSDHRFYCVSKSGNDATIVHGAEGDEGLSAAVTLTIR